MEIERKYLPLRLPENLNEYPHAEYEQGYLCTSPVVRVRREGDKYVLTYKGAGLMAREEYNLPLTEEAYRHLLAKTDGITITKTRYFIPLEGRFTIELDLFHGIYEGLCLAEVEFPDIESAEGFTPPAWFGEDVTLDPRYHNSLMSKGKSL